MHLLRVVHRWIGLALAVVLAIVGLSGGLLLLKGPYYRRAHPALARPIAPDADARYPAVLESIDRTFAGTSVTLVKFPQPGMNAFQVWLADGREALVDPAGGAVITEWRWWSSVPGFLFELHAHLLAEGIGTVVNGAAALGGLFLVLSGVIVWWPRRRGAFRLRGAWPRDLTAASLLRSHAATGTLVALPLALFLATGAAIVFYDQVETVMQAAFDDHPVERVSAVVPPRDEPRRSWATLLPVLRSTLPEGRLVFFYPGTPANAGWTFRKRMPGEWHPNGRSYILLDPYAGEVLQAIDARRQGLGTRVMYAAYPVHAAMVGGIGLVMLAAASGVALCWLATTGAVAYLRGWVARRPRAGRRAAPARATAS